ncbi:hypothetical protein BLA6863_07774 [Burkholderia lata]|uniref:Uncharacterized protein n=1 Tax=Burkholderia lata (strain ATCC 17760 / DSM 23089 / LMG 22485 / NCIMB 9086 / R18194 / 383) TaxID=482957 RepID=A0A6P2T1S1_BURL3|nr:hypothetical protein BLA6863_07774 [Burkholderia lata]
MAASGAWTRNTHGQLASATIAPPTIGPKPSPMPNTIPQIPNARPRSRPSRNWCDSTAIWQISIAPPLAPCNSRPATSTGTFGASPHSSDVAPNSTVPITYTRLRPNRSASVPAAISTVVHAIVYAFMIHCMPLKSPCSTCSSVGRITGTLEISRPNISDVRQTAASATAFLRESDSVMRIAPRPGNGPRASR